MSQTYKLLLRLYPRDYRARFAAEMLYASSRAAAERRGRGPLFTRFIVLELVSLPIGAGREWFAKLTTDRSVRGRCLPDVRMMRPPGVTREVWFARDVIEAETSGCL